MRDVTLIRASGVALIVSAPLIAAFLLLVPYEPLTSRVVTGSQWLGAHTAHMVGAVFLMLGVGGIALELRRASGLFGEITNGLVLLASALFLYTGILTAIVMPVAGRAAPELYGADGAFTNPPFLLTIIVSILLAVISFVLLGVAMIRSKRLPRGAAILMIVGIAFVVVPPDGSVPRIVGALAVLWPIGLLWTGVALVRGSAPADA